MNPLHTLAAFLLGLVLGAVPAYLVGKGDGKEAAAMSVGALKTSVDSCTAATKESNALVARERAASDEREQRMAAALTANEGIAKLATRQRSAVLAYQPRGNGECERTVNAVRDQLMGGGR